MSKNKKSNLEIRKASPKDFNSLIKIQKRDGFIHAYYLSKKRLQKLFDAGELFFIAYLENKPVGFVSVYIEIRARMHFLSVKQEVARGGIGSFLLERIISESKKYKVKLLYVYTEANSDIEGFLEKKGFEKVGYFKNRFGDGRDANIFSYKL